MDKAKELANDPAKLEAELKKAFEKMDSDKKGFVSYETLQAALVEQFKAMGLPQYKTPSKEEMEKIKQIIDPEGSGKITYENFAKLIQAQIQKAKAAGKL